MRVLSLVSRFDDYSYTWYTKTSFASRTYSGGVSAFQALSLVYSTVSRDFWASPRCPLCAPRDPHLRNVRNLVICSDRTGYLR